MTQYIVRVKGNEFPYWTLDLKEVDGQYEFTTKSKSGKVSSVKVAKDCVSTIESYEVADKNEEYEAEQ